MKLDENDFLTFQLYTASKSSQVKKNRRFGWGITVLAFASLAYLGHLNEKPEMMMYFIALAIISLLLFPLYSSWRYKRNYRKHIKENLRGRFNEECSIEFGDDIIITRDKTGETKLNLSEIEAVNEIKDYYFLKLTTGASLIIAKNKVEDRALIEQQIRSLADKGIQHNVELDWRWR